MPSPPLCSFDKNLAAGKTPPKTFSRFYSYGLYEEDPLLQKRLSSKLYCSCAKSLSIWCLPLLVNDTGRVEKEAWRIFALCLAVCFKTCLFGPSVGMWTELTSFCRSTLLKKGPPPTPVVLLVELNPEEAVLCAV